MQFENYDDDEAYFEEYIEEKEQIDEFNLDKYFIIGCQFKNKLLNYLRVILTPTSKIPLPLPPPTLIKDGALFN